MLACTFINPTLDGIKASIGGKIVRTACCVYLQAVSYEEIFTGIIWVGGVKKFLEKFRQVRNLKILDRLLGFKSFFQRNIPGFICSVFRSA